jgi:hypothetical protein
MLHDLGHSHWAYGLFLGAERCYHYFMVTRTNILEHVIEPRRGDLTRELAEYILSWDFSAADHRRYAELSEKAQAGALTAEERAELEEYLSINDFLTIVQTKARTSLARANAA